MTDPPRIPVTIISADGVSAGVLTHDAHGDLIETTIPRKDTPMDTPKYPNVNVKLVGEDGNAYAIMGRTAAALKRAGVSRDEVDAYMAEATSGDYDHLLRTTMSYVNTTDDFIEDDDDD